MWFSRSKLPEKQRSPFTRRSKQEPFPLHQPNTVTFDVNAVISRRTLSWFLPAFRWRLWLVDVVGVGELTEQFVGGFLVHVSDFCRNTSLCDNNKIHLGNVWKRSSEREIERKRGLKCRRRNCLGYKGKVEEMRENGPLGNNGEYNALHYYI